VARKPYGTSRTATKLDRKKEFGLTESIAVGDEPMALWQQLSAGPMVIPCKLVAFLWESHGHKYSVYVNPRSDSSDSVKRNPDR